MIRNRSPPDERGATAMAINPKEALVDAIKGAAGPVSVSGRGTGVFPAQRVSCCVAGWRGSRCRARRAETLVAKPGHAGGRIRKEHWSAENQRLAFEPMDQSRAVGHQPARPTIRASWRATSAGPAPHLSLFGAARDFLLGVRFVRRARAVVKNGGRVMKNVTGYVCVTLLAGSFGTLGGAQQVSMKACLPRPRKTQARRLFLHGLEDAAACRCDGGGTVAVRRGIHRGPPSTPPRAKTALAD